MSTRPFIAARVEQFLDKRIEGFFRLLGWREKVIPYTGYGTSHQARVLGRVVLVPQRATTGIGKATEQLLKRRGWRNFFTAVCVHAKVRVTVGDQTADITTDRGGYIDHRLSNPGLSGGWHKVTMKSTGSKPSEAEIQIVDDGVDFGLVSDIDDTIISTWLPRPLIAAWNSFIRDEAARQAVPGMARMYHALLEEHPGAPLIFVSTGAWNTHGFLNRFLKRHGYPPGAMLLTDWGPTNTGWFRSGMAHKQASLGQLARDFPNISWVLVGDDGQHDPEIYTEFAKMEPDRVRAIAIRELTPTEQVLAHGTTTAISSAEDGAEPHSDLVEAPDGRGLLAKLRPVLAGTHRETSIDE